MGLLSRLLPLSGSKHNRNSAGSRYSRGDSLASNRSVESPPDSYYADEDRQTKFLDEVKAKISGAYNSDPVAPSFDSPLINLSFLQRHRGPDAVPDMRVRSDPGPAPRIGRVHSVSRPELGPTKASVLQWTVSRKILEDSLQSQSAADASSGGNDLQGQEARLRQRLHKLRLDMHVMEGDGNCQFRAVSFGLYGTEAYHSYVRKQAVAHLRGHPEEYAVFLGEEFNTYLREMARPREWGDELTLRAICDAFKLVINVITSTPTNWFLRYNPKGGDVGREIFLTYISPIHYNAIRRRSSMAPVRDSFRLRRQESAVQSAYDNALSVGNIESVCRV